MLITKRTYLSNISVFFRMFLSVAVLALGTSAIGISPAAAQQAADEPVRRLNDALLHAMRDADQLGYQGRYDILAPVLQDVFSFDRMAAFSVGRSWQSFDSAAKQAMIDVFTRLTIAEFASRFNDFAGEQFQIGEVVEGRRGLALVENSIVKSDGEEIDINYVVGRPDEDWRIVDIRLGGAISELSLKRSEYGSILRSNSPTGLIQLLEGKVRQLASGR